MRLLMPGGSVEYGRVIPCATKSAQEYREFLMGMGCPRDVAEQAAEGYEKRAGAAVKPRKPVAPTTEQLRARLAKIDAQFDKENRDRLARLSDDSADPDADDDSKNENDDREEFNSALNPLRCVGYDERFVYCLDQSENDDAGILRYAYLRDDSGKICIDRASRARLRLDNVSSMKFANEEFRARELRRQMRAASGITGR